jgi:uncharacterized protein (DUF1499 family)
MARSQNLFTNVPDASQRRASTAARIGCALAVACALAALASGAGYRLGLWHFRTGFVILRWAGYVGLAAAALSLLGAIVARPGTRRGGLVVGLAGVVIGLATAGVPWQQWRTVQSLPYIHDITTDTDHPPAFVAVLPLRKGAENSVEYSETVAEQQKKAYPDLAPALIRAPVAKVFERAEAVARAMGWEIVASAPNEGRIEATDTTLIYGFKDDVVVRIVAEGDASRVDVRSVSRVGKSDVGINAKRIRAFLSKLSTSA